MPNTMNMFVHGHIGNGHSDGYEPLESIDLGKVSDFDEMLQAMAKTSFGGRKVGEAADVLYKMITDPDCYVVMTLSGAMTVAKMGLLVCEMIDSNMVQAIVSTGALITHGLVENSGMTHFKYNFDSNDEELGMRGYDRVYDTLELEKNLDDLDEILQPVFNQFDEKNEVSSRIILHKVGEHLHKTTKGRGIVKSAYAKKVPIYIPAFTDCELGLDFGLYNRIRKIQGQKPIVYNPFLDLEHFAETILQMKTLGIFTIGGGAPRNWAQQVGPYLDLIRWKLIDKSSQDSYFVAPGNPYLKQYKYAVRICPEPANWGGLSGCTYSEGVSWGKFIDLKKGGYHAEVPSDATIVWPILMKGIVQRLKKNKIVIKKNFQQ